MDHSDWPAFLAAILAEPDDNTVRLVAADFLEENGDHDRAAFIRLQIALVGRPWSRETEELMRRERSYLDPQSQFAPVWAARECPELVQMLPPTRPARGPRRRPLRAPTGCCGAAGSWSAYYFAPEWLRHGAAIRVRNPVRQVALRLDRGLSRDHWVAGLPALQGLHSVDFYRSIGAPNDPFFDWLGEMLPGKQVTVAA